MYIEVKGIEMSRRSSYGYSSYRSGSYGGYGGYRRNRRGDDGKTKAIIITAVTVVVLAAAAVGVCAYLGVFSKDKDEKETGSSESSQVSVQESKTESSGAEQKSKPAESKPQQSSAPAKEIKGEFDGNVFVYDKQGYQIFYGTDESAKDYTDAVSSIKKSLGKDVKVYNMIVPTHGYYSLPDNYKKLGTDEKANISNAYKSYGDDVITINVSDVLENHKQEYIFFKTDHNWTGLGAYYGYTEFCKAAGVTPIDIKTLSTGQINDFRGSLAVSTRTDTNPKGNKILNSNPDTVKYYRIPGNYTCTLLESGKTEPEEVPLLATFAEGSNAYSVFIWGNNPYMHIKTSLKTGRKLCIIKDSYGGAFTPFTVNNFDEIYVVNPTLYNGNVIDYIKKNKYTDVLVLHSIVNANTKIRTDEIKNIIR